VGSNADVDYMLVVSNLVYPTESPIFAPAPDIHDIYSGAAERKKIVGAEWV